MTAVQADAMRGLGGYAGAMYVYIVFKPKNASIKVCCIANPYTAPGSWQQAKCLEKKP
jgi:hypothetical protein